MFLILRLEILTSPFRLLRMTRGGVFCSLLAHNDKEARNGREEILRFAQNDSRGLRMTVEGSE